MSVFFFRADMRGPNLKVIVGGPYFRSSSSTPSSTSGCWPWPSKFEKPVYTIRRPVLFPCANSSSSTPLPPNYTFSTPHPLHSRLKVPSREHRFCDSTTFYATAPLLLRVYETNDWDNVYSRQGVYKKRRSHFSGNYEMCICLRALPYMSLGNIFC